jgi:hypothetical protein
MQLLHDPKLTLAQGAVALFPKPGNPMFDAMLDAFSRQTGVPIDVPFEQLDARFRRLIFHVCIGSQTDSRCVEFRRKILQVCLDSQIALPLSLRDFSTRVETAASEKFSSSEMARFQVTNEFGAMVSRFGNLVSKLLLSLYFSRVFSPFQPVFKGGEINPLLESISDQSQGVPGLENKLKASCAQTLRIKYKHLPRPVDLARLFYDETPTPDQVQACEEIISQIRNW